MICLGSGKGNVPQKRKAPVSRPALDLPSCHRPITYHPHLFLKRGNIKCSDLSENLSVSSPQRRREALCYLEKLVCLQWPTPGQEGKENRKLHVSQSFPLSMDAHPFWVWTAVCCPHWNPTTLPCWVFQYIHGFLRSASPLFLSVAPPWLVLHKGMSSWCTITSLSGSSELHDK